jgi:phage repressor protein C with HTH and peptisase S24 domain
MARSPISGDPVRALVAAAIEQRGLDMATVSRAIGRNHAYLQQYLTRGTPLELPENVREQLAPMLGLQPDQLRSRTKGSHTIRGDVTGPAIPRASLVGPKDLPVFAAARGGKGHLLVNFEPIEYVKRPHMLDGVPQGYGILVTGDSMEPRYNAGDILLVHPHLRPLQGKGLVLYDAPPGGEAEAMVKVFLRESHGDWHLRQYNPAEDFAVKKADWPIVHRIVGLYDGR